MEQSRQHIYQTEKTGFNIDIYHKDEEETNTIKKIIENRSYPKIILNTFAA